MELIDIGVNLTGSQFKKDRVEVIERAAAVGVKRIIVTGTSDQANTQAAKLVKRFPGTLYMTAGVHPHNAKQYSPATSDKLREYAKMDAVVAIGECGLDYNRMRSPQNTQLMAFEAQLAVAADVGLPVFLHERDAVEDFTTVLRKWRPKLVGAVVHCFTGEGDALKSYLDLDCHIGITGWICDERRGTHLQELVKLIPADKLMVETDAPWLTPRDLPGKVRRNEPMYLPHIVERVARCVGKDPKVVAQETTDVAVKFFGL